MNFCFEKLVNFKKIMSDRLDIMVTFSSSIKITQKRQKFLILSNYTNTGVTSSDKKYEKIPYILTKYCFSLLT